MIVSELTLNYYSNIAVGNTIKTNDMKYKIIGVAKLKYEASAVEDFKIVSLEVDYDWLVENALEGADSVNHIHILSSKEIK